LSTIIHCSSFNPIYLTKKIGTSDLDQPDFRRAGYRPGWRDTRILGLRGVTSQLAATSTPLYLVIAHAPGHMFGSDLRDEDLTIL